MFESRFFFRNNQLIFEILIYNNPKLKLVAIIDKKMTLDQTYYLSSPKIPKILFLCRPSRVHF